MVAYSYRDSSKEACWHCTFASRPNVLEWETDKKVGLYTFYSCIPHMCQRSSFPHCGGWRTLNMMGEELFEACRLNPHLSEPLEYCIYSSAKEARGRNRSVKEKGFLLHFYPQNVQPQVPLCGIHCSHRAADDTGRLLGGRDLWFCSAPGLPLEDSLFPWSTSFRKSAW